MSEIDSPQSAVPSLGERAYTTSQEPSSTPIALLAKDDLEQFLEQLDDAQTDWISRQGFTAKPGEYAWLPQADTQTLVVGSDGEDSFRTLGNLSLSLPEGSYHLTTAATDLQMMGWGMGAYQFSRYREPKRAPARLLLTEQNDSARIINTVDATALARDLINTPAADMAPSHLSAEVTALGETFDAEVSVTVGDALLDMQCGAIHAVGRAAEDPPCLVDLTWGNPDHPRVTIVGKGVTFDSGGLDLKPASGMRLMKKDMGGAATAIGLAYLIMAQQLPLRLRLLVPSAENAVAGNAFRPGDVLHTRKGLTVEIDNTDAEGRLLLCDALAIACEESPDYIFDFATLTGSARSAVGTELAAMFCNDDTLADDLSLSGNASADPVWRMPLHGGYDYMLPA